MCESCYTSRVPYQAERIHAASVYCSDGRMGEAFDDFLTHGLKLPRYDRVALPGGPACLAGYPQTRLEEQGVLDELQFLVEGHQLERVVLIQHVGCAFYGLRLEVPTARTPALQRADLVRAAYLIRRATPLAQVEGYYADVVENRVVFERVGVD